ncbi:MAG: hypothetical protein ACXABD_08100 [Candidatus Thorarchaeota archaeon]
MSATRSLCRASTQYRGGAGPVGAIGPTGIRGLTGPTGNIGLTGPTGPPAITSAAGPQFAIQFNGGSSTLAGDQNLTFDPYTNQAAKLQMNGNSDFTGDMNIAGKTIVTSTDQIINLNAGGTGTLTMETSGSGDVITRATGSGGARMLTDNGPVQISAGGTGPIDIATASKDIKVQVGGTGGLNMLTNNGPIKIDAGGTGPIDIATAFKDISVQTGGTGNIIMQTNNGNAAVLAGGTGAIGIATNNGPITASAQGTGQIDIMTQDGSMTAMVGGSGGFSATTQEGDMLLSSGGAGNLEAKSNDGNVTLNASGTGNVDIKAVGGGKIDIKSNSNEINIDPNTELNIYGKTNAENILPHLSQGGGVGTQGGQSGSVSVPTPIYSLGAAPAALWKSVYTREVHAGAAFVSFSGGGPSPLGDLTLSAKTVIPNGDFISANPCDLGTTTIAFRDAHMRTLTCGREQSAFGMVKCMRQAGGSATIDGNNPSFEMRQNSTGTGLQNRGIKLDCSWSEFAGNIGPALLFTDHDNSIHNTILHYGRQTVDATPSLADKLLNVGYSGTLDNSPILDGNGAATGGYQLQFTIGNENKGKLDVTGTVNALAGTDVTATLDGVIASTNSTRIGPALTLCDPSGPNGATMFKVEIETQSTSGTADPTGIRLTADTPDGPLKIATRGSHGMQITNSNLGSNAAGDLIIKNNGGVSGGTSHLILETDRGDMLFKKGVNFPHVMSISEDNRSFGSAAIECNRPLKFWTITSSSDMSKASKKGDTLYYEDPSHTQPGDLYLHNGTSMQRLGLETFVGHDSTNASAITGYSGRPLTEHKSSSAGATYKETYNSIEFIVLRTGNTTVPAGGLSGTFGPYLPPNGESAPYSTIVAPMWSHPQSSTASPLSPCHHPILSRSVIEARGKIQYVAGFSSTTDYLTYTWSSGDGGGMVAFQLPYAMGGTPSTTPDPLSTQGRYYAPTDGWITSVSVKFYASVVIRQGVGGGYVNVYNQYAGFFLGQGWTSGTPDNAPRGFPNNYHKPQGVFRYLGSYQVQPQTTGGIANGGQTATIPAAITWNLPTEDWVFVAKGDPLPYISMVCPLTAGAGSGTYTGGGESGPGHFKMQSNNAQSEGEIVTGSITFESVPERVGPTRGDLRWDTGLI